MSTFTVQTFGRGRRRWVELSLVSFEEDTGRAFSIPLARARYQLHSGYHDIESKLGKPENEATVITLPYVAVDAWFAKELETVAVPMSNDLYTDTGYPHAWAARVSNQLEDRLKAKAKV